MVTIEGIKQNNVLGKVLREKPEKLHMKIIYNHILGKIFLK